MQPPPPANTRHLFETRRHFAVLDGLRGVAALSVVLFHYTEMVISNYSDNFIGHGFLAVDFFFCLSGFVIAYAYDGRIRSLGMLQFFEARLIRLHPMVVLGSVLGLLALLLDPFGNETGRLSSGSIAAMFAASVLVLPYPAMASRSFNLFSLNAPAWSLFWEYVASVLYATILSRLSRRVLLGCTVAAGANLLWMAHTRGNVLGGWSGPTFWDVGTRLAYSFTAGMAVYRWRWIARTRLGFGSLSVLLMLAFVMPYFAKNWLAEALVVLLYFPLLIALGAGAEPGVRSRKLCNFAGNLSYPLYMTHYAAIWIFEHFYRTLHPSTQELALVIASGMSVSICFAWLVTVFYDTPVRSWLTAWRKREAETTR